VIDAVADDNPDRDVLVVDGTTTYGSTLNRNAG
jgi:hypothetical protein